MDNLPDQLRQFVLDTYVFLQIIQDPTISTDDKLQILENLFDGVQLPTTTSAPVIPDPPEPIPTDTSTSTSTSSSATVPAGTGGVPPGTGGVPIGTGTSEPTQIDPAGFPVAPVVTNDPTSTGGFTTNFAPSDAAPTDAATPTTTILPNVGPPIAQSIGDFGSGKRRALTFMRRGLIKSRTMRHGLRKRQYDEGTSLDDASKLGPAALHAIAGPAGSLDPMGQYDAKPQGSYTPAKPEYTNTRPGYSKADYNSAPQDQDYSPYEADYNSPDYEPKGISGDYGQYQPDSDNHVLPTYVNNALADLYGADYTKEFDEAHGYDNGADYSDANSYADNDKPAISYWSSYQDRAKSIASEGA
ncbi:hypothetical protein T440DRAFT_439668 [Plenodomus tracheiphilus IPT5]|uniref:Uncharacterized protein n=1 Tax=Plenodomus tracheiphilus IPT5 TaxID=1408161 RepID=A0A6A7BLX1_9PLEO|nr:hypothetical protein T440DRAFT_439668 [Plenodomus tracheiphilus IPT5]